MAWTTLRPSSPTDKPVHSVWFSEEVLNDQAKDFVIASDAPAFHFLEVSMIRMEMTMFAAAGARETRLQLLDVADVLWEYVIPLTPGTGETVQFTLLPGHHEEITTNAVDLDQHIVQIPHLQLWRGLTLRFEIFANQNAGDDMILQMAAKVGYAPRNV